MRRRKIINPKKHFLSKIDTSGGSDACHFWLGYKNHAGYGKTGGIIWKYFKERYVHRIAYKVANPGVDIIGLEVMHLCNEPSCCNAKHLERGTQKDNMDYMKKCNRQAKRKGSQNPNSKLTEERVFEIVNCYASGKYTQTALATQFGVSISLIGQIVRNKLWKHAS